MKDIVADREQILNLEISDRLKLSLWEFIIISSYANLNIICDDRYIVPAKKIEFDFDKKQCRVPFVDTDTNENMYQVLGIMSRLLIYNSDSGRKAEVIIDRWFNARYFHMNTLYKKYLMYLYIGSEQSRVEYESFLFCVIRANICPNIEVFKYNWKRLMHKEMDKYEFGNEHKMLIYSKWFD